MEEKTASGGSSIDAISHALEVDTFRFEIGDQLDKLLHRSAEPIEFPDYQRVGMAQVR